MYELALLWEAAFRSGGIFLKIYGKIYGWFMSTPAHTSLSVQQFLAENGIDPHSHPPYSPDLTPSDFFVVVFSPVKKVLKGKHFADVGEVKQKAAEALKGIKID